MTVLDRVPVEAITAARPHVDGAKLLRSFLALLALPFTMLGWTAKAIVFAVVATAKAVWFAATWIWSAIVVGWESGPSSARSPEGS